MKAPGRITNPVENLVPNRKAPGRTPHAATTPERSAKATTSPTAETPGTRLASRYFTLLEQPPGHRNASVVEWPGIFTRLLGEYAEADLLAAMEWALTEDTFWPDKLFGAGAPAAYFAEKVDTLVQRWRGKARSTQIAQKPLPERVRERPFYHGLYNEEF